MKTPANGKIGFFDSGIGGFTILSAVRGAMPEYDYVYYGDTAHVPYGNKSEEEVFELTRQGIDTLFVHGAQLAIIACNTASAETLRKLQDSLIPQVYDGDRRILGVIIPTVETIIDSGAEEVLLIGTKRTVNSKKYDRELSERTFMGTLTSVATPDLVPLLEDHKLTEALAYLDQALSGTLEQARVLVLGCTHYVLLKGLLRARYPKLIVMSQDEIIPAKLSEYIHRHPEIGSKLSTRGTLEIILTKDDAGYRNRMQGLIVA